MAEIRVERGGPTIWPWIMGLLVLALLIWGLTELAAGRDSGTGAETADSVRIEAGAP